MTAMEAWLGMKVGYPGFRENGWGLHGLASRLLLSLDGLVHGQLNTCGQLCRFNQVLSFEFFTLWRLFSEREP